MRGKDGDARSSIVLEEIFNGSYTKNSITVCCFRRDFNGLCKKSHCFLPTFSVTVSDLIGPVAAVGLRAEGETVGTGEVVADAVHTVSEVAAVPRVTKLEVPELVRAVGSWLRGFCKTFSCEQTENSAGSPIISLQPFKGCSVSLKTDDFETRDYFVSTDMHI